MPADRHIHLLTGSPRVRRRPSGGYRGPRINSRSISLKCRSAVANAVFTTTFSLVTCQECLASVERDKEAKIREEARFKKDNARYRRVEIEEARSRVRMEKVWWDEQEDRD